MIEDVMTLLDMLCVWDVESDGGWKDMARLGLDLLVLFAKHENLEVRKLTVVMISSFQKK